MNVCPRCQSYTLINDGAGTVCLSCGWESREHATWPYWEQLRSNWTNSKTQWQQGRERHTSDRKW